MRIDGKKEITKIPPPGIHQIPITETTEEVIPPAVQAGNFGISARSPKIPKIETGEVKLPDESNLRESKNQLLKKIGFGNLVCTEV